MKFQLFWSTVVSRDTLTHRLISSQLEVPRGHDRPRDHRGLQGVGQEAHALGDWLRYRRYFPWHRPVSRYERRDLEIDDFRTGAGKALKAAIPDVKIVLAEPEAAGLLASGVATERNADGSPKVESCVEINQ